ncbi:MAG: LysM peptidoglycan-binding domain-containing protein [Ignavibacteria bacterium]|nr:LysM peptidoglycan-binding domain-containing protein [Ignavibacteria bacterium]
MVRIDKAYKVEDLAECVGLTADEFFDYNPFLLQQVTPSDVPNLEIRVPKGRAQTFASNIVNVSAVKLAEVEYHKVQRGETIFKLAKRFSVSVDQIKKANNMTHTRRLAPGEMLRIPKLPSLDNLSYATAMDNLAAGPSRTETPDPLRRTQGREKRTFAVERGMTLGGIANRYSVTVADLMLWNSMRSGDPLVPGAEFAVWVRPGSREKSAEQLAAEEEQARIIAENESKAVSMTRETRPAVRAVSAKQGRAELHRVANGETLAGIAAKYNVSIENLKSWNQLRNTKVRPGKVLRIYADNIARALPQQASAAAPVQDAANVDEAPDDASPIAGAEGTAQTEERTHTVKKGETLWAIASEHGVTTDQVKIWNKLRGNAVQAGRKLIIMGTEGDKKNAEAPAPEARPVVEPAMVAVTKPASESKVPAAPFAGRSGTSKGERPKTYTVKKGDNLWSIARNFDIPVEQLSLWNALKDMQVMAGQELLLAEPKDAKTARPAEKNAQSSRDAATGSYVVKKGDNLYAIALETGVSTEHLREWNDLKDDVIKAGQELRLTSPSLSSSVKPAKQTKIAAQQSYTVKDGDTLYSISRKLGVTISDLQRWNDVGENLRAGQELSYQTQR